MDLAALVATPLLAYLLVVGLVALDATFPAIPSDALVVSAGALAAAGHLDLAWAAVAVVARAMTGECSSIRSISTRRWILRWITSTTTIPLGQNTSKASPGCSAMSA